MIKNFLYSIFLHSLILLIIFISFLELETLDSAEIGEFSADIINNISEPLLTKKTVDIKPNPPTQTQENKNKEIKLEKTKPNISSGDVEDKIENIDENPQQTQPKINNNNTPNKVAIIENLVKNVVGKKNAPTLENSGLSSREKLNILTQLKACYQRAIQETKQRSNYGLIIQVSISVDGIIDGNFDSVIDQKKYHDPQNGDYKIMINNAKKALDLCSPLRNLPQDKYNIWKEIIVKFDSE